MRKGQKIAVAMSGGVDSSTAAALLAGEGCNVVGLFLKFPRFASAGVQDADSGADLHLSDAEEAAHAASKLNIPFHVLDCSQQFERDVVEAFCAAYLDGLTPNPCVECNRMVKFGFLMEKARELGADRLATGHYARVEYVAETGRYVLRAGLDAERDQSYFLYSLSQDQLACALFPLGEMTKHEARAKAKGFGLDVHDRPASRDICFLAGDDYRTLLKNRFPELLREGPIVDVNGKILGRHKGVAFHTIGQRKGLGIGGGRPLYVLAIRTRDQTIVVGARRELLRKGITVKQLNWIPFDNPSGSIDVSIKIRYRQPGQRAVVRCLGDRRAEAVFEVPQAAVAPGQSAVFYSDDVVVGGGIIE